MERTAKGEVFGRHASICAFACACMPSPQPRKRRCASHDRRRGRWRRRGRRQRNREGKQARANPHGPKMHAPSVRPSHLIDSAPHRRDNRCLPSGLAACRQGSGRWRSRRQQRRRAELPALRRWLTSCAASRYSKMDSHRQSCVGGLAGGCLAALAACRRASGNSCSLGRLRPDT